MHLLAVHLVPVLAAEKSKTAYYIAGGLLVAWALIVSVLFGLRKPDFPGSLGGQRIVMAISAVLVIAAASTAVITSGGGTAAARRIERLGHADDRCAGRHQRAERHV